MASQLEKESLLVCWSLSSDVTVMWMREREREGGGGREGLREGGREGRGVRALEVWIIAARCSFCPPLILPSFSSLSSGLLGTLSRGMGDKEWIKDREREREGKKEGRGLISNCYPLKLGLLRTQSSKIGSKMCVCVCMCLCMMRQSRGTALSTRCVADEQRFSVFTQMLH